MRTQGATSIRFRNILLSNWLAVVAFALLLPAWASGQALATGQKNSNPVPTSANSISVDFPSPETVGDVNVVVVGWSDSVSTVKSVSDVAGNKYILAAGTNSGNSVSQAIYYAVLSSVPGGGALNTITVKFNQNAAFPDIRIFEYSGIDNTNPLETAAGASGTAAIADSGPGKTLSATDLLVGAGTTTGAFKSTLPPSAPPNPTFTVELLTPVAGDIDTDAVTSSANAYNATANVSGAWVMQMIALRGSGQTAPAPSTPGVTSISPTSGGDAGGDLVTITGNGFVAGATVTFGGISGINCSVSGGTTITCSTPPSPNATVPVVLTNPDGQPATSPVEFTYNISAPAIANVTSPTTNGGMVTITGSDFVGPATVTVDGVPATGITVSNSTTILANVPAHTAGKATVVEVNADSGKTLGTMNYVAGTGAINFVQSNTAQPQSSETSVSVPYLNSQSTGDLNVVVIGWSDTKNSVLSVKDSNSNNYVKALSSMGANSVSQVIYYAAGIKAGTNTVTVTFSGSAAFPDVRVMEYSGVDPTSPLDNATGAVGSGTPAASGPLTTHTAVDLVIGAGTVNSAMTGPGPNLDNFTLIDITKPDGDLDEQLITSSAGTFNAQADVTSGGSWVMQAVAFKAPANASSFTVTASPASASVSPGSSATYTVSVTAQNGFSSAVSLSCSAPANVGIACSVSPSSVTPGGAPANATLTVTTTGATAALVPPHHHSLNPLYAVWLPLPAIALAGIGLGSRRRKLVLGILCLALLALCVMLAGCGGGGSSSGGGGGGGTPAGSYNITVTATSGNLSHSTQTTLTVQ